MAHQSLKRRLAKPAWQTLRRTLGCPQLHPDIEAITGPIIFACLHRDILGAIMYVRPRRPHLLVSQSDDGGILVHTLGENEYGFIRGATGEDGGRALVKLRRSLEAGHSIGLAVDGPKGPFGVIRDGVFQLSKLTGCPIVPLLPEFSSALTLNSWDHTQVPLPFSRLSVKMGPILRPQSNLSKDEMQGMKTSLKSFFGTDSMGEDPQAGNHFMKTQDLRSPLVRLFTREDNPCLKQNFFTRLFTRITDQVQKNRVDARPKAGDGPLLVSIGNLALGGTGKTPVVMSLAQKLAGHGLQGAILTRGYGSKLKGPLVVQESQTDAGDEARLMAFTLKDLGWPVVQSRLRPRGLQHLLTLPGKLDIVLLEDAHQTRGLARHLDLLIVDTWITEARDGKENLTPLTGPVFPFGPWRESARGARRAQALLVESSTPLPPISNHGQPVFSFRRTVDLKLIFGQFKEKDDFRWTLVSGIARPERFEEAARRQLNQPVVLAVRFRDHAAFGPGDVKKLQRQMDRSGSNGLVTTAKDWVKLAPLWDDTRPVCVLELQLHWHEENALDQWLAECVENQVGPRV